MTPTLFSDFMNADAQGRLPLNCVGTVEDLTSQGIELAEGLSVILSDGEIEVDAELAYSTEENVWVGIIDWGAIRHLESADVVAA